MPKRSQLIVASLVLSLASLQSAHAQSKPSKAQLAAAQNHYKRASAFQDLQQFDQAAKEYLKAYQLYPHPEFLFNIAEVYRLGKRFEDALDYYKRYLAKDPNGRGANASRARVTELEPIVAAAKARAKTAGSKPAVTKSETGAASAATKTDGTPKSASTSDAGSSDTAKTAAPTKTGITDGQDSAAKTTTGADSSVVAERPGRGSRGRTLRIAGLASAGVGVVALGLGVKFGLDAKDIEGQVEAADPWDPDLYDRGEAKNRNMVIMYGVGVVAVVAGGAMYYLGRKAGQEQRKRQAIRVTPVVTGSMTGLAVGGTY